MTRILKQITAVALAGALLPCAAVAKPQSQMTPVEVVNAFNQMGFFDHHPIEAAEKYIAPDMIEHDPTTPSGRAGVIAYLKRRDWSNASKLKDKIYQTVSQGDRVVVFHHVTQSPNDPGLAFVDIFRVKGGLIVEHWDVGQPVPKTSANKNGFFGSPE